MEGVSSCCHPPPLPQEQGGEALIAPAPLPPSPQEWGREALIAPTPTLPFPKSKAGGPYHPCPPFSPQEQGRGAPIAPVATNYLVSPVNTRIWGLTTNMWIDKEDLDIFSNKEKRNKG